MTNKTYDVLKWIALVLLPAVQVLWLTLGKTWDFPYLVQIGATIAAVDVFLGSVLGLSGIQYNKLDEGVQTTFNDDGFIQMITEDDWEDVEDWTDENENLPA